MQWCSWWCSLKNSCVTSKQLCGPQEYNGTLGGTNSIMCCWCKHWHHKRHVTPLSNHQDLRNAMVLLKAMLVSHDADTSTVMPAPVPKSHVTHLYHCLNRRNAMVPSKASPGLHVTDTGIETKEVMWHVFTIVWTSGMQYPIAAEHRANRLCSFYLKNSM